MNVISVACFEWMKIAMDADEILTRARAESERPGSWVVFPLLRNKLIGSILYWIFGVLFGAGLLALIVPIVIPFNYTHGLAPAIVSTILLVVLLFMTIGSLVLLVLDARRLAQRRNHIIVVTTTDFVKQEGQKVVQVPLQAIKHVTPRGRAPVDRTPPTDEGVRRVPGMGENVMTMFMGRGLTQAVSRPKGTRRKRMRTPTSLAFLDTRDDSEVLVVNDTAYGDPFYIAAVLKERAASAQSISTRRPDAPAMGSSQEA
jgi:hypothetical protein